LINNIYYSINNFCINLITDNIWNIKQKSTSATSLPSSISDEQESDLSAQIELQLAHFKQKKMSLDDDLFKWWRENAINYPDLAKLARILHCIPATSISSERLFSKAGLIYSNTLRNRFI